MALTQIQKSSTFKPDMVGDIVEVTVYDQKESALSAMVGVLGSYATHPDRTTFKIEGIESVQVVPRDGYTISITHYEFNLGSLIEEDDE